MATGTAYRPPVARGWRRLLRQSYEQADFDVRGFPSGAARPRLEAAARAFLGGFNEALAAPATAPPDFADRPDDLRGFAVEGAAMQAALLDLIIPGGESRLAALLRAHERRYVYLIHVGAGWAMARMRVRRPLRSTRADPLLRWLAYDGRGFSAGFFATPRDWTRLAAHRRNHCTFACAIQHQGLGRSIWFRACGDPDTAAAMIATLPRRHHGDAWAGVGLAAGYGCGTGPDAADRLRELAGPAFRADLGQGAAFAAGAWRRAGEVPDGPAAVLPRLTLSTPEEAAGWAFSSTTGLEKHDAGPAEYAEWRRRVRSRVPA